MVGLLLLGVETYKNSIGIGSRRLPGILLILTYPTRSYKLPNVVKNFLKLYFLWNSQLIANTSSPRKCIYTFFKTARVTCLSWGYILKIRCNREHLRRRITHVLRL